MGVWIDKWIHGWTGEWLYRLIAGCIDGWTSEWLYGLIAGCIDKWIDKVASSKGSAGA